MQYRKFGNIGLDVSALGFGCMRFPTLTDGAIDAPEAIRMLRGAIDSGLNYVDTAYGYHQGKSEELVGKALKDGYREKVFVATKSPTYMVNKEEDFDKFLTEQLERLECGYIDFYLLHTLSADYWKNVVLKFGILDKLKKAKADGKIRHLGFSFHDDYDTFKTIIDGFDAWEFCQIQLNYIDVENQAGIRGLEYAAARGLGVVVMEPLLGGKLADVSPQVKKELPEGRGDVEWALDFLWNRPEVATILSGMSTFPQVRDNLLYADRSHTGMLSTGELEAIARARGVFQSMSMVPCTKCAYCMPCPFGLDIPGIYEAYNLSGSSSMDKAREKYETLTVGAHACTNCQKCAGICPQHIDPAQFMPKIAELFTRK